MPKVWTDTKGFYNRVAIYNQTLALQRLGHGFDWKNIPPIFRATLLYNRCDRLVYKVGRGNPHEIGHLSNGYKIYRRIYYTSIWFTKIDHG